MVNRRGLVDYHYYVPYRGCLVDYLWYERNLKYKKALMGPLSLIFTRFTVPKSKLSLNHLPQFSPLTFDFSCHDVSNPINNFIKILT